MTTYVAPLCMWCKHLFAGASPSLRCAAFPQGIPGAVLRSEVDHRKRIPGDRGVLFEQDPSKNAPS